MENQFECTSKKYAPLTHRPFKELANIFVTIDVEQINHKNEAQPSMELFIIAGQVVLKHEFEAMRDGYHDRIDFRRY